MSALTKQGHYPPYERVVLREGEGTPMGDSFGVLERDAAVRKTPKQGAYGHCLSPSPDCKSPASATEEDILPLYGEVLSLIISANKG